MKILMITGSYPPDVCGVGDYTNKLTNQLNLNANIEVTVFSPKDWKLINFFKYIKHMRDQDYDYFHMQYPTEGYGYSFLPLLLFMFLPNGKKILTAHELFSRNAAAKIYTYLLLFLASKVILTNSFELDQLQFSFLKSKVEIIQIGSNISAPVSPSYVRPVDLIYFGHIRPLKGLEKFRDDITVLKELMPSLRIAIVGQTLEKYNEFSDDLISFLQPRGIEFLLNQSEEEVAKSLSASKIAYLPFPDGISTKRGSLLACIENGCQIISNRSEYGHFNTVFENNCTLISDEDDSVQVVQNILNKSSQGEELSQELRYYFSWENIALLHLNKIYLS